MALLQRAFIGLAILVAATAWLYNVLDIPLKYEVLGIGRSQKSTENIYGEDFKMIPDTFHCEDIHYHRPSGLIFGAAEADPETRWKWFPPIAKFDYRAAITQGTIIVIDPQTKSSTRLSLRNFHGPFITHGIDIFSHSDDADSIYIYAVNHLPNPEHVASQGKKLPQARSQIEVFVHKLGTAEAEHLGSLWHPLIRTPNDIYVKGPTELFVTNDHHYRAGVMRLAEDVGFAHSDIIHLELESYNSINPPHDVKATVARKLIHNPNGLGHGKDETEILIARAAAGVIEIANLDDLKTIDSIQLPNTVDNPSYFHDPYVKETGRDASGYVIAGLAVAAKFPSPEGDPVVVWLVQPGAAAAGTGTWKQKLLFQDNGKTFSTASTAVLVAIDPKENDGRKQAWLFVTGPMSMAVASMKVDL